MGQLVLEINLISAQDLKPPSSNVRRMRTYAVAWIERDAKLRTRVDSTGRENPSWNDKFLFRASEDFVYGETSAVDVQIFSVGRVRDSLVGTVRFILSNCLERSAGEKPAFAAVQVRRPSGRFHGALNIAAAAYPSENYPVLERVPAVSFRILMEKNERELRRLSRCSHQSSVREMAGKTKGRGQGGYLLCFSPDSRIQ